MIGQELAREYLRLHELAAAGVPVLAVYFDTIICETSRLQEVPAALTVSDQLGKYKQVGITPRALGYTALYDGQRSPNVGALVKLLKIAPAPDPPAPPPPAPSPASAFTRPTHGGYTG